MPIVVNNTTLTALGETGGTNITKVYARQNDTSAYVLVFEKGVATILYFFGNWKMNKLKADITSFFTTFASSLNASDTKPIWIFPPNCYIKYTYDAIPSSLKSRVKVGVQNICQSTASASGAYTGQISATMAKDCGASIVLIGNYECRNYLNLTNTDTKTQVESAITAGLDVVFCVGEDLSQRQAGNTATVLQQQLAGLLSSNIANINKLYISYEPVWAIGTGYTCSAANAQAAAEIIKAWLTTNFSTGFAQSTPVLFGGSTNANSINQYVNQNDLLGVCVSGVSTNATNFANMINTATRS